MPNPDIFPVDITLTMAIIPVGAPLTADKFTVAISAEDGEELYAATNDDNGFVIFQSVSFSDEGTYNYTARQPYTSADWNIDTRVWPIQFEVTVTDDKAHVELAYPDGVPTFTNAVCSAICDGPFEFPELIFDAPGVYEYTLKELTPPGGGWTTDDSIIRVIVTVIDDGLGNLVATISYPDGFPSFKNIYETGSVSVIISGCKTAIGAKLPAGRFVFGLFDQDGNLISTATNNAVSDIAPT